MNVKTAADNLNLSMVSLTKKLRQAGIGKIKGQYFITDADIKKVLALKRKDRKSNLRDIAADLNVSPFIIRKVAARCKIKIKREPEKLRKAMVLYLSDEYTYKGIIKRL